MGFVRHSSLLSRACKASGLIAPINKATTEYTAGLQDEEPRILEHIRRGERIDHYETKRRHKDGRLLDISLTVSPVKHVDGRIVGASKIARDITNQKRAKEIEETLISDIQHRSNSQLAVIEAGRGPFMPQC